MSVIDFTNVETLGSSLLPKRYDLVMYKGDTVDFTFVLDDGTNPINFTGATAVVQIKTVVAGTEGSALTTTPPTISNAPLGNDGTVTIHFSDECTNYLSTSAEPTYVDGLMWELQITDGSGNVRTYLGGKITMHEDIIDNE